MKIDTVNVEHFRGIEKSEIKFSALTTLIGENNAGKSTFLAAIVAFYQGSKSLDHGDFYNGEIQKDVEITVTFCDLTPSERELFASNMVDDKLIVTRVFSFSNSDMTGKFNATVKGNPEFGPARDKSISKTLARERYDEIREKYSLPKVTNADQIEENFSEWEKGNPEHLSLTKIGGFRGFQSVGRADLERKTKFLFVPAITDARTVVAGRGAPIVDLVDTITRQTFENDLAFQAFQTEINEKAKEVTDPSKSDALNNLAAGLNEVLSELYSDSEVELNWEPVNQVNVPLPASSVLVQNHQHKASIDKVGHGLQRAIFLSAIRYLAERDQVEGEDETKFSEAQSDIIIAIEEPELYQHPVKQHLFSRIFRESVKNFNASNGIRVQILLTTHSTAFIDFSAADEIRLLRRESLVAVESGKQPGPSPISVSACDLSECAKITAEYLGKEKSEATYRKSLHIMTREIREAFFGKKVILVEGVGDKVILNATYEKLNRSPESEGIVIVETGGKSKMDKPALILKRMGIPTYIVFDNDETSTKKSNNPDKIKNEAAYNVLLQKIQGVDKDTISDWPVYVDQAVACWDANLEQYIETKLGEEAFNALCAAKQQEYGGKKKDCTKNPVIMGEIVAEIYAGGTTFGEIEEIISLVDQL